MAKIEGIKEALDLIGNIKESFKRTTDNKLHELMLFISKKITDELKLELAKTTNKESILSQSIEPLIVEEGNNISVHITANDYWKFVEEGVNGWEGNVGSPYTFKEQFPSFKMQKSIQTWMGRNGISDVDELEQAALGTAIVVKRWGLKPKHFIRNVLDESFIKEIEKMVSDEMGNIVYLSIK